MPDGTGLTGMTAADNLDDDIVGNRKGGLSKRSANDRLQSGAPKIVGNRLIVHHHPAVTRHEPDASDGALSAAEPIMVLDCFSHTYLASPFLPRPLRCASDVEHLRNIFRHLTLVRVAGTDIYPELPEHRLTELIPRKHTANRILDYALGMGFHHALQAGRAETARKARVRIVHLLDQPLASHRNLVGFDDDHMIANIQMRAKRGLVLSVQDIRDIGGKAAAILAPSILASKGRGSTSWGAAKSLRLSVLEAARIRPTAALGAPQP